MLQQAARRIFGKGPLRAPTKRASARRCPDTRYRRAGGDASFQGTSPKNMQRCRGRTIFFSRQFAEVLAWQSPRGLIHCPETGRELRLSPIAAAPAWVAYP